MDLVVSFNSHDNRIEEIIPSLNNSYHNYQYNPKIIYPCLKVHREQKKQGRKRKVDSRFQDWFNYHNQYIPIIEKQYNRFKKKRKIVKSNEIDEMEKRSNNNDEYIENIPFVNYLEICDKFGLSEKKNDIVVLGNDDNMEDYDYFNSLVKNESEIDEKVVEIFEKKFLIPPNSCFVLTDISNLSKMFNVLSKYSVIVLDPPWSNKSAQRKGGYQTSHHDLMKQLINLPLNRLFDEKTGALLFIWTTNRVKYHTFIENELVNNWRSKWKNVNIRLIGKFFWVKISFGEKTPIFPFNDIHQKPYEPIIVFHLSKSNAKPDALFSFMNCKKVLNNENECIFLSPTNQHSQKPNLFKWTCSRFETTTKNVNCLEFYARNCFKNVTSIGNEVIKFQNLDYFCSVV